MAKRYFWLKLKDDFFNQKEIKMLRKISGGDTFTIIYLKLLLVSLKNDGKIYYDGIANSMAEEVALDIDEEVEDVQITLNYLKQKGLLVFNSDDEMELSDIHQMIGSETAAASRMRKHRALKNEQERNNVTKKLPNSYTEIDIEIDTEKEIDTDAEKKPPAAPKNAYQIYQECFGVLNSINQQDITFWIEDLSEEMVIEAMKKAVLAGKPYSYAKGIMKQWSNKGIKTVEDAEAEEVQFSNNHFKKQPVRKEALPYWAQDGYKYEEKKGLSDEEVKEIREWANGTSENRTS